MIGSFYRCHCLNVMFNETLGTWHHKEHRCIVKGCDAPSREFTALSEVCLVVTLTSWVTSDSNIQSGCTPSHHHSYVWQGFQSGPRLVQNQPILLWLHQHGSPSAVGWAALWIFTNDPQCIHLRPFICLPLRFYLSLFASLLFIANSSRCENWFAPGKSVSGTYLCSFFWSLLHQECSISLLRFLVIAPPSTSNLPLVPHVSKWYRVLNFVWGVALGPLCLEPKRSY